MRLISILSPFRSAVPESGAPDLHPGHPDVSECPEDEHDDPPDTAGRPLHQSVAGLRRIPTSGMLVYTKVKFNISVSLDSQNSLNKLLLVLSQIY